jgi:serine/threonine protein kinase
MTPERWQQVEDLLQDALDRSPAERAPFLREACSGDEELAFETGSLIDAYDEAGDFMEQPAIAQDARVLLGTERQGRVGDEIGLYQVIDHLAAGGMGEVYLARDPRLDRLVALKVLPAYFVSDEGRLRRFQTEARAASALNHSNILTIYEVGQFNGTFFIAAEYIDGPTLRARINAGSLSLGEVLDITDQLLCGLTAAHAAGIVHRDIKPENIMQRPDGVVKILDFGIVKLLEQSSDNSTSKTSTQTEFGAMLGTIGYMSPEQVRSLPVDERTDIWSCGVVLYEMLTGLRPFTGNTHADTLVTMLEREPELLFRTERPADPLLGLLQAVVCRALRKDLKERYQTTAEMRAGLEKIKRALASNEQIGFRVISADTSVADLRQLAHTASPKFRREVMFLIGAVLLVALFAGAFLYQRQRARALAAASAAALAKKSYLQMSESEKLVFIAAQEQRISAMMGDRPVKLNDEALGVIKADVDRYLRHLDRISTKPGEEDLRLVYARAPAYIPTIARAFTERKIPVVVGIYLPMIESAYRPCYENQFGAKGLFQFLPVTAEQYGVTRADMCDIQKMAPAAAHYIADRMAELGDDSQSMTLVLLSYNRGPDAVRDSLRRLRETDANYERNFWTLFANRKKLDESFQRESAWYVPQFFAAAIIGENPDAFDLRMPALSSFANSSPGH